VNFPTNPFLTNLNTREIELASTGTDIISSNFFTNLNYVGFECLGRTATRDTKVTMAAVGMGRGGGAKEPPLGESMEGVERRHNIWFP
jgi:hypothetical protein